MDKKQLEQIAPGTVCAFRVGWPGNDHDLCVVTGLSDKGDYLIRFQVYGQGRVINGIAQRSHDVWWIRPLTGTDHQRMDARDVAAAERLAEMWRADQLSEPKEH